MITPVQKRLSTKRKKLKSESMMPKVKMIKPRWNKLLIKKKEQKALGEKLANLIDEADQFMWEMDKKIWEYNPDGLDYLPGRC